MFVFALFNLQGTSFALRFRASLTILAHPIPFVKKFFLLFTNFFFICALCPPPVPRRLSILPDHSPFVKRYFSFSKTILGTLTSPQNHTIIHFTQYRQSVHTRHHFCGKQLQRPHRCLHRGMQRNYVPKDSSAKPPLHVSLV